MNPNNKHVIGERRIEIAVQEELQRQVQLEFYDAVETFN